jgi:SAM-dependent methyltransferase
VSEKISRGLDVNLRSGPQMREYEAIADRIAAEVSGPVLDWGCGFGQVTDLLRGRGVDVVAYDYRAGEPAHVGELERFPGIPLHVGGDPVALPFEDGSFAAVLSCGVLEHVESPEGSLRELHRVLRPQGRLLVYKLPNRFSYLEWIAQRAGLYYHGQLPNDRVYDRRRIARLLASNGFRMDAFRRTNMLPLTISHPVAWRLSGTIWTLNRLLAGVPLLNLLATNVEADATAVD